MAVPEAVADPQFAARGLFVDAVHPAEGPFRQLGPVFAGAPDPGHPTLPDPAATATAGLLAEAGLADDEIAALAAEGVIA